MSSHVMSELTEKVGRWKQVGGFLRLTSQPAQPSWWVSSRLAETLLQKSKDVWLLRNDT